MHKTCFGPLFESSENLEANLRPVTDFLNGGADEDGFIHLNCRNEPFVLGGITDPKENGGEYDRLAVTKRDRYSPRVRELAECTSGGSVRFATDADEIYLSAFLRSAILGMPHFCDRGVFGVDTYVGTGNSRVYVGEQMQFFAHSPEHNEGVLKLPGGVKEVLIHLPLYAGIQDITVGFKAGDRVGAPSKRTHKPIAVYGSSITQGGCVSRPANAFVNVLERAVDADCRGFGFSGSAMGEREVAEYIASCELSCFIMDYDYNSPSVEHLKATHEPFFKVIREKQPNLPVIFVSHPFYAEPTETDEARIAVVRETYEKAKAAGDENVWFVDSHDFFTPEYRDLYSVDFLHPNDLGQFSMAETIYPALVAALEKAKK